MTTFAFRSSFAAPLQPPSSTPKCLAVLDRAKQVYLDTGLLGSDEKDIRGLGTAKLAKAEVCADLDAGIAKRQEACPCVDLPGWP